MSELTPTVSAQHGAFFLADTERRRTTPDLRLVASYGYKARKSVSNRFAFGEGLVGQAAAGEGPDPHHRRPAGLHPGQLGLGEAAPVNIIVLPLLFEEQCSASSSWPPPTVQRGQPHLPRAGHRDHRRRAQHDHRQHAHRGAAQR
jgi:hypothetical protein